MAGAPQPDNRRARRNAAKELANAIMRSGGVPREKSVLWELGVGLVPAVALFLIDKAGKNSPLLSVALLLLCAGFLLRAAYRSRWVSSAESGKQTVKRYVPVSAGILIVVVAFGIWVWPQPTEPEYHTVVDRHLTLGQADGLKTGLERVNFINKVKVGAPQNDGEAWDYAADLETEFGNATAKAGWTVNGLIPLPPWDTSPGVTVLFSSADQTGVSSQQIDLAFIEAQLPLPKHGVDPKLNRGEIFVIVGRKD